MWGVILGSYINGDTRPYRSDMRESGLWVAPSRHPSPRGDQALNPHPSDWKLYTASYCEINERWDLWSIRASIVPKEDSHTANRALIPIDFEVPWLWSLVQNAFSWNNERYWENIGQVSKRPIGQHEDATPYRAIFTTEYTTTHQGLWLTIS